MTETPSETPVPWRDLAHVALATLACFVSFGCLLPVFPLWVSRFAGDFTSVALATGFAAGAGLILARPIAAKAMEGHNRRPMLAAGGLVVGLSSFAYLLADDFNTVLAVRFFHGLGFGLMATAGVTLITDLAPPARRGEMLGYFGALNALAFLVGPAVGALVWRHYDATGAFSLAGVIALLGLFALPGVHEAPKAAVKGGARVWQALKFKGMRPAVFAHFFALVLEGVVVAYLPLRMATHGGWMSTEAFFAVDAIVLIGFRVIMGPRFDTIGRGPFIVGGLVAFCAAGLVLGLADSGAAVLLSAVLYGLGFGAYIPAAMALVGDLIPASHRARGFAAFMLAFDLAFTLGALALGPIADGWGVRMVFTAGVAAPAFALLLHLLFRPAYRGSSA